MLVGSFSVLIHKTIKGFFWQTLFILFLALQMYNLERSKDAPDLHAAQNMEIQIKTEPIDNEPSVS